MMPYALSEKCFLATYAYGNKAAVRYNHYREDIDANGGGLYLVDSYGNKELVYRHPLYCAMSVMPFRPRKRESPSGVDSIRLK